MAKHVAGQPEAQRAELVVITGLSGSGKATVLKAFEDLGYYAVDNLPIELIPKFAELAKDSPHVRRAALVIDIREGDATRSVSGAASNACGGVFHPRCCFWKPMTPRWRAGSARPGGLIRSASRPRC